MSKLLELAERCEAATGPEQAIDFDIAEFVTRAHMATGKAPAYTASLDAAMKLAIQGISAADVLRKAIERCTRYGCPTFIEALPRFVAGEWLRALASTSDEGGENA